MRIHRPSEKEQAMCAGINRNHIILHNVAVLHLNAENYYVHYKLPSTVLFDAHHNVGLTEDFAQA